MRKPGLKQSSAIRALVAKPTRLAAHSQMTLGYPGAVLKTTTNAKGNKTKTKGKPTAAAEAGRMLMTALAIRTQELRHKSDVARMVTDITIKFKLVMSGPRWQRETGQSANHPRYMHDLAFFEPEWYRKTYTRGSYFEKVFDAEKKEEVKKEVMITFDVKEYIENLQWLDISNQHVSDISVINDRAGLTHLATLKARYNLLKHADLSQL